MTDEEMAEEYVLNLQKKGFNCFSCFSCDFSKNLGFKSGVPDSEFFNQVEQAFLAGLKAGRPKWHKVADGDLPSEEGGWVCNQNGLPCFFDWGTEQWLDCEGTQIRTTEWCYMPHKE